ncbi:MAG: DoxX family protein [Acidobacteria bacterium]|nr:DoxX family protein [Acidobacteriota bacterium]
MSKGAERLRDYAPLLLRLAGGAIFLAHGYQKIFTAREQFAGMIAAIHLPAYFAYVGALVEFVGGIILLLGLLVRLASFLLAGQMTVAIVSFHILYQKQGLIGGFEFPLAMLAMMLALTCLGSGAWSLDRRWFGWR